MAASRETDVLIVGAGISGLTAARLLLSRDPNLRVLVLEAKDRVGGRTQTVQLQTDGGTDSWDVGGQWVGRCQPHIMALLKELEIEVQDQYLTGTKFLQVGTHNTVTSYKSDIPTMSPMALIDLHRIMRETDKLSLEVDPADPYSCPNADLWDAMTLEMFMRQKMWTTEAMDTIRACMRCMFGAELSQISALYFLTYVSAAGSLKALIEGTPYTGQEYKVKGGAQQISQRMYEDLGSSRVLLSEPVAQIGQEGDLVTVTSNKGHQYTCQRVIMAVPPAQIGKIAFSPNLPVETKEIIKRMLPSNVIKCIITYKVAFWRDAGQSGEMVTNGGASTSVGCEKGPLSIVYDAMSSKGQPALLGFIGGIQAVQWQQQKFDSRRSAVLKSLAECFGDQVYTYIDYREKIWDEEPYNEGGPVSCVGPGAMRYYAKGLRHPFGKIHFAGTESATVWCGFMNGAVQAGRRAAVEVLYDLRPQLVTPSDLAESKPARKAVKKRSRARTGVVKCTVAIGVVTLIAFSARKLIQRLSSS